ncbi:MAG: hypothetical protein SV760_09470 [Halobacteria archaeon]|nr:hypothetical protein [Halobacteria archaeon]
MTGNDGDDGPRKEWVTGGEDEDETGDEYAGRAVDRYSETTGYWSLTGVGVGLVSSALIVVSGVPSGLISRMLMAFVALVLVSVVFMIYGSRRAMKATPELSKTEK